MAAKKAQKKRAYPTGKLDRLYLALTALGYDRFKARLREHLGPADQPPAVLP